MAGYCTFDDVQTFLSKITFSSTSKPSIEDVELFITDIAGHIAGVLSNEGFATTQTDAEALKSLKLINMYGAGALAEKAAFPGSDSWAATWRMFQDGLKQIRKSEIPNLALQAGASSIALPSSLYTVEPSACHDPVFRWNETQW